MRKIVDTILPTTMVGSYPRPHWFNYQLLGRDPRVAFKHEPHEEAYADATRVIIQDQEEAGLDIVCDGQMYFDDYIGSIGSFCWYMYERIPGFDPAKEEHPAAVDAATMTKEIMLLSDWAAWSTAARSRARRRSGWSTSISSPNAMPPGRSRSRSAPARSISPGTSTSSTTRTRANCPMRWRRSSMPRCSALATAGANFLQYEDLGAWLPLFTKNTDDFKWIGDVVRKCIEGVDAKIAWHFCYGNAWGNRLSGLFPSGYESVLPYFYDLPIDQFVLDFANRDMVDIAALKDLPKDKEVAIGVIDVRTSMIETPEEVAARIRKVIEVVSPERVYLTTDCGMKPLARIVARMKLKALADGAALVRKELGHG